MAVYLITAKTTPRYKIGMTDCVKRRIQSMQTDCPYRLELVAEIETDNDREYEKMLHDMYDEYRVQGEWFELPEDVVSFLRDCSAADILKVRIALFLLSHDMSLVLSISKVDEIRQTMTEVLNGSGLQNRWTKEGNAKQGNRGGQERHLYVC